MISAKKFQRLLLQWFDQHGRKHLPWQQNKTPYRVWVSEIMLQQTQVATVIPYFQRFMQRFPEIADVAHASDDEIMHYWAGLGYYSRARHLHRAAKMVMENFNGVFPDNLIDLQTLPGVGTSTAGAILSIAFNQPAAILDGNVKRVLARLHALIKPINEKNSEEILWKLANKYMSKTRTADYTQALMDLGATICTRTKPQCDSCPLQTYCAAYAQNLVTVLPKKKAGKTLPVRAVTFLIFKHHEKILLHKRAANGIWGGLWSVPELAGKPNKKTIKHYAQQQLQTAVTDYQLLVPFRHTFSHYHLDISPVLIEMISTSVTASQEIWYNLQQPETIGLPKPTQTLLNLVRKLNTARKKHHDASHSLRKIKQRSRRPGAAARTR